MKSIGQERWTWRAACAFVCLVLVAGAAQAVENKTIQWRFDNLPFWELPDRGGSFGGYYASGSFTVVVDGDAISVRDAVFNLFRSGPLSAQATTTGFGIFFQGNDCYEDLCGAWGLTVAGDLTQQGSTLPVVGGGFNFTDGHYSWSYGSFAPDPASFVTQVSYVTNVPEPAAVALWAIGCLALAASGAATKRRASDNRRRVPAAPCLRTPP